MNRKRSREVVMELIFQMTLNKESNVETIESFMENTDYDITELDLKYINSIIKGVYENTSTLDETIEKHLVNWKLSRLSKINLTILRLGTYEILFEDAIPDKVAINEAIELTKKYSDEASVSFVNGVLDKVVKNK